VIRALVQESACVGTHENVFVPGPTGVGKSFVACALLRRRAATGTRLSTHAPNRYFATWRWSLLMAAFAVCWRGLVASTFW
jgi:hypothetical protein